MVVFQHVLQVCCLISIMVPISSYVLFAANVEDFRNLAKKFIPSDLAEKLTDLVSHNGGKSVKDRVMTNEDISIKQNVRERTAATMNDEVSTDITMIQIKGGKNDRQNEQLYQKSQIKFEYDEIKSTKRDKNPPMYHEHAKVENINVRKRPVRLDPKPHEKRFEARPPIQVHVEFEDDQQSDRPKIRPTVNNFQKERTPIANMKKRPREDISEKRIPIHNLQETPPDDYQEGNVYKKSNFDSRFGNAEQKNSYVNKMAGNQNGNRQQSYSKYPHDSRFESDEFVTEGKKPENELTKVKGKWQPQLDYDYDDITSKFVTLDANRYRTVRDRISNTNSQDLSVMKLKETFSRAATLKEQVFVKSEMRERVIKQRQRTLPSTVTAPARDYDMRQKKVTPTRKVEFGLREPNSQGRENEMRIHNERENRDRIRQKQKAIEDNQRYEKPYTPKPTNNDYDLPYERPHPSKSTNKDYDQRYDRPRPNKPTNNDYDVPYERPHPTRPTKNRQGLRNEKPYPFKPPKNDYDLPIEKPYSPKPAKNDYDLPYEKPYAPKPTKTNYNPPYENPYPSKTTKSDYDLYYEKPNPSKPTINDYDLYYEKSHMSQPTTSNHDKIFLTKQNTPKEDDYFDDDHLKPPLPRMPGVNIQHKQAQKDYAFYSSENPSAPSIKNKNKNANLGAKRPAPNEKKPVPDDQDQDLYEEVVHEAVKARTESLNFDADYDNNTDGARTTRHIMKGTGIPTRQTYKMSSPDYYKRLPRIVEKYDFNEPIPEGDREREVPNDKLVLEQGRVNKKVKQQKPNIFKEEHEERPEFEPVRGHNNNDQQGAIMEEFSLVR